MSPALQGDSLPLSHQGSPTIGVLHFSHYVMSDSCDPIDCSPPGSSVHGIHQARKLEWASISFSKDLPDPGIEPRSPALQVDSLPTEL